MLVNITLVHGLVPSDHSAGFHRGAKYVSDKYNGWHFDIFKDATRGKLVTLNHNYIDEHVAYMLSHSFWLKPLKLSMIII